MGQINSTSQTRTHSPNGVNSDRNGSTGRPIDNGVALDVVEGDAATSGSVVANQDNVAPKKRTRTESVRKSVLSRIGLNSSKQTRDVRPTDKKWRVSRRWSKAPVEPSPNPSENAPNPQLISQGEVSNPSDSCVVTNNTLPAHDSGKAIEPSDNSVAQQSTPLLTSENGAASGSSSRCTTITTPNDNIPAPPSVHEKGEEKAAATGASSNSDEADMSSQLPENASNIHSVSESPVDAMTGNLSEPSSLEPQGTLGDNQRSPPNPTQLTQEERALRHFSPGGTLVVVQGVVHTTETPRATNSTSSEHLRATSEAASTSGSRSQRNSLLPNFLQRRNSGTSVQSRGSFAENGIEETLGEHMQNEIAVEGGSSSDLNISSGNASSGSSVPETAMSSSPSSTDSENQGTPRRAHATSNSVDVLGALLSVATAATAASLLSASPQRDRTQRAAPAQPTQASLPGVGSHQMLPPSDQAAASPIPALARALATANPVAAAAIAQRERERERIESERSRVRGIWQSIRERILHGRRPQDGTRPRRQNGIDPVQGVDHTAIPDSLFSTLARAFNLDQGQDESPATTQPSDTQTESGSSNVRTGQVNREQEETPPDSFERFLIDLQTDLRNVLTELELGVNALPRQESRTTEGSGDSTFTSNAQSSSDVGPVEHPTNTVPSDQTSPRRNASPPEISITAAVSDEGNSSSSEVPVAVHRNDLQHEDNGDLIVPTVLSETASEAFDTEATNTPQPADEPEVNPTIQSAITTTDSRSQTVNSQLGSNTSETSSRHTTLNSRGVNWWRMYRFPPMRMNQTRPRTAVPTANSGDSNLEAGDPLARIADLPLSSAPPPAAGTTTAQSAVPATTSPPEVNRSVTSQTPDSNLVVPVIVVGLQSLGAPRQNRPTEQTQLRAGDTIPQSDSETNNTGTTTQGESDVSGPAAENTEARRGRNWQARAARMLNRVGRRNGYADTGNNDQNTSSSRTFFIYVIGGYYPPDHQIVTGSDYLDSFEALRDLAELLGQVKPPVATAEEIQSSGLEIIKASALEEYERTNNVASNCIEKCLICLDDYESEDDIRLMSCKHAFHKTCVDHWLTTGRNNCPACRSQGVKTGNE